MAKALIEIVCLLGAANSAADVNEQPDQQNAQHDDEKQSHVERTYACPRTLRTTGHRRRRLHPLAIERNRLMPMTAQPSEVPTLRVAALPDDQLAQMTLGFLRECYLRLQESDHKNAEMKRVAAIVAEPHKKHGRVTIDIKPFSVLHDVTTGRSYIDSAEMRRRMPDRFETEDLRSVAPELAKSSETMRSFRHFDLEDLHADEVITVDVPLVSYLERTVRTDPTQVALPEGWADELGQKMLAGAAAVVSNLPRPEVVNNVTVEPAPITLLEADDGELDITFDRDSAGRIVKAHTK